MSKIDLKIKVNKETFTIIQDACFEYGIYWEHSRDIKKEYNETIFCIYYRKTSNSLQFGNRQYNYEADKAQEVTVDEFIQKIQQ